MELMQKALQKTQGVDDYLVNMGGITNETAVQLPPKFFIQEVDRFAGVGDPIQHLRQYLNFVKIKGLNEQQVLQAFPLSLAGLASNWWRAKASKMINRPNEKDQVNIVMKGLLPVYYNRMFEQLCNSGMRIEDAIDNGKLDKREGKISTASKKIFGSSSKTSNIQANINRGHSKPVDPTPYPDPLLKNWNTNLFCHLHQKMGHSTDECIRLKHEIQDLIDNDVIPKLRLDNQPNVHQNPLSNYQRAPPQNQINFIEVLQKDRVLAIDDVAWDDLVGDGQSQNTRWYVEDITEIEEEHHLTRGGRHFKPCYLEEDYPERDPLS
uniref:Retrotransposon gag domain-containing protein n=1 Tax=Fagus sylvatica TaxID=28930 RepID=A0A2N9FXD3_FAGSY